MALNDRVKTVVLVMMENRSFDHILGHLSHERIKPVDGLRSPFKQFANTYKGDEYPPFSMKDRRLDADLPHEFDQVATQLRKSAVNGKFTMQGFVEAYAVASGIEPGARALPMSFFASDQVPITSFLASEYAVCDRWFSSIPTSTQPNRAMAFTGDSSIHDSGLRFIPNRNIVFDWLERAGVPWRVYHDGLSFFTLFQNQLSRVLGETFVHVETLQRDLDEPVRADDPQVIIVEPSYQDAPHFGSNRPNDNHAPLAVSWGEEFIRRTYDAVQHNPARWESTVMVLYYDEHGGFADHVPPEPIGYTTTSAVRHSFESLGPRVPAIIVSPLVERDAVCHELFDHTSMLQLLAELFTPGTPYSDSVQARAAAGIQSVSVALTRDVPRTDTFPAPDVPLAASTVLGQSLVDVPDVSRQSFEMAANTMLTDFPAETRSKFPELLQWKATVNRARAAQ